jgi:hypothetical protein
MVVLLVAVFGMILLAKGDESAPGDPASSTGPAQPPGVERLVDLAPPPERIAELPRRESPSPDDRAGCEPGVAYRHRRPVWEGGCTSRRSAPDLRGTELRGELVLRARSTTTRTRSRCPTTTPTSTPTASRPPTAGPTLRMVMARLDLTHGAKLDPSTKLNSRRSAIVRAMAGAVQPRHRCCSAATTP